MAETSHGRSRRAALAGLLLQTVAAAAAFALGRGLNSQALYMLALYVAGGLPIWFITLLVFRQHELAALEAMDLELLRREKQATGGGEALFEEQGGAGPGFLVARTRLEWMRRWLIPAFGLLTAAYLVGAGIAFWSYQAELEAPRAGLQRVEIGMVLTALLMLLLFFFSKYASGMARVVEWQLLRGGACYMLGSAVAALAVIVALGVFLYRGSATWERAVAYTLPVVMVVLGAETLVNFLLDIYRPRSPGVEPRACFDSRLLGLLSEPGGIAHSLAEAVNYQFGFEVSQTWFYQLLQRTLVKLLAFGAAALWLLSCLVVVQPYEGAIVERLGRQVEPERPLEPGLHLKWPWPIDIARRYNTDQLHEFRIGYRDFYEPKRDERRKPDEAVIELWTDPRHGGRDHFDFIIAPSPPLAGAETPVAEGQEERRERAAQHLARMEIVFQYRISPTKLADFTQHARDPHAILRRIAWNEVVRFAAGTHIDALMGELRQSGGELLRQRISRRADELKLGVEIKYVGLLQVHPTQQVAEAFRRVVTAQQEKIAEIRKARVTENQVLSQVAGDKWRAVAMAHALDQVQAASLRQGELERELAQPGAGLPPEGLLDPLRAPLLARLEAQWQLTQAQQEAERIREDFDLGLGGSLSDQARAEQAVLQRRQAWEAAEEAYRAALAPLRERLLATYPAAVVEAWLSRVEAEVALGFWNGQLERYLVGLEGEAAMTLAQAQARRWELEMRAAGEVALLQNERFAYAAAPEIYKARSFLRVLSSGITNARKYFLAFEPGKRKVHVRFEAQEQVQPGVTDIPTNLEQK